MTSCGLEGYVVGDALNFLCALPDVFVEVLQAGSDV